MVGLGLFAAQLVENLKHIDELHHKMAFHKCTAINVAALLDFQVFAGLKRKGRDAGNGDNQVCLLVPDLTGNGEAVAVQGQDAIAYIHKLLPVVVDHTNHGFAAQAVLLSGEDLFLQPIVDQPTPVGNIADFLALGAGFVQETVLVTLLFILPFKTSLNLFLGSSVLTLW